MNHTIQNERLRVTVAEEGAQLQSILDTDGTQYLWQGDPRYWADRALNLFPFVARLVNGEYMLDGQMYHLPIHGFAPYENFRLLYNDGQKMALELTDSDRTYAQYPRHFSFQIIYGLTEDTLDVCFCVENRDEKPLYFGLGGHPGFNVPLEKGKTFENYHLRFSEQTACRQIIFSGDCFVTGERRPFPLEQGCLLPLRHALFDNDAIVLENTARQVTLESDGGHAVTLSFPDMPYLGLWHCPKTDAPYLCIEPWTSLPAHAGQITVFERKADLICLPAGAHYHNTFSLRFHR